MPCAPTFTSGANLIIFLTFTASPTWNTALIYFPPALNPIHFRKTELYQCYGNIHRAIRSPDAYHKRSPLAYNTYAFLRQLNNSLSPYCLDKTSFVFFLLSYLSELSNFANRDIVEWSTIVVPAITLIIHE